MLNRYFTAWVDAVMAHGGIVDKYMGDAIIAFYGAPAKHSDDPVRALRSAFDMLRSLSGSTPGRGSTSARSSTWASASTTA